MREILQTIFSLHRRGCPWDRLPHDWLPKSPVYDSFAPWRDDGTWATIVTAWRERRRVAAGRAPTPSATGLARPSGKTPEMGGPERGEDGGQNIQGRKRPLGVETLGVVRAVLRTRAGLDAGVAAPLLRRHGTPQAWPRLVTSCADPPSHHPALDAWRATPRAGGRREVKARPAGIRGFPPGETLGECTPQRVAWPVSQAQRGRGAYNSLQDGHDANQA
jgi:putative transposase